MARQVFVWWWLLSSLDLCGWSLADAGSYTPTTRFYHFNVTYVEVTRLCWTQAMVMVNGQYPGPTVYAREGDRVVVNVTNNAVGAPLTVHWHGVAQRGSPWADGPAYVTQCPIAYGKSFVYDFQVVGQRGTLFWHAHVAWVRATVYGALVILPAQSYPFVSPDKDAVLLLGEWWSESFSGIEAQLNITGGPAPPPQANTINGLPGSLYDTCGVAEQQSTNMYMLEIFPGNTYLLRLINAALHTSFYFSIANHTFTIVEADGAYIKLVDADTVCLAPGQTMNVLLRADKPPGWYRIVASPTSSLAHLQPVPATGLLYYAGASGQNSLPSEPDPTPLDNPKVLRALDSLLRSLSTNEIPVPIDIDRYFFLAVSLGVLNTSCPKTPTGECQGIHKERYSASLNNISFVAPNVSILELVYEGHWIPTDFPDFPPTPYNYTKDETMDFGFYEPRKATKVCMIDEGDDVEMVLQDTSFGVSESHPMHLHGYSFYVVGSGLGVFDPISDPRGFNLDDPPLRNTVAVPAGGWSVIRFKADNPGVWFLHCHVESHQYWGMGMVFWVKDTSDAPNMIPPPPHDIPQC